MPLSVTPNTSPSLQDLIQNLVAVHVTDYLPHNNQQIAGGCTQVLNNENFKLYERPLIHRHTLHWALGNVPPEHEGCTEEAFGGYANTYTKRPYALVTRLSNLTPQLLNIFAYDTITIGDYTLSYKDWLVAPQGTKIEGPKFNLFYYDPETSTLEQAIQALIVKLDGWQITFTSHGTLHNKAYINGSNVEVNNAIFLRSIINELDVSFGTHQLSISGWQSSYVSALETINTYVLSLLELEPEYQQQTDKRAVAIAQVVAQHAIKDLKEYAENLTRLPINAKISFLAYMNELECWYNLLDIEQYLIQNGRTLVGAGLALRNNLLQKLSDKKAMLGFVENNLNSFAKITPPKQQLSIQKQIELHDLVSCLSNIPWATVSQEKSLIDFSDDQVLSRYLVLRLLTKGNQVFMQEDLEIKLSSYYDRVLENNNIYLNGEPFITNILKELTEFTELNESDEYTQEIVDLRRFVVNLAKKIPSFRKVLSIYNDPKMLSTMPPSVQAAVTNEVSIIIHKMLSDTTQSKFMGWLNTIGLPIGHRLLVQNQATYSDYKSTIKNKC